MILSKGDELGCWRINGLAKRENGKRFLEVVCLKCLSKFVLQNASLVRRKTKPKNCKGCRNALQRR